MFEKYSRDPKEKKEIRCELCGKIQDKKKHTMAVVSCGRRDLLLCPGSCEKTIIDNLWQLINSMRRIRGLKPLEA